MAAVLVAAMIASIFRSGPAFAEPRIAALPEMKALAAAAAPAAGCSPNSDDWTSARSGEKRCVFKGQYSTRRRIVEQCLRDRPALGTYIYQTTSECSPSGGVEAIGQARAIKYLNDNLGVPPPGNQPGGIINPMIQWEPTLNGGSDRPDIIYYDRAGNTFAEIIEAKVKTNKDYDGWGGQVARYAAVLVANGVQKVTPGTVLNRWGQYEDWFQVYSKDADCKVDGQAGFKLSTYRAISPTPGLLHIEEVKKERKCEQQKRQPPPNSPPIQIVIDQNDDDHKWPIPPILLPLIDSIETVGATTLADDVAAYGSVEAAAAALTAETEGFEVPPGMWTPGYAAI
ncbi:hypothetical protein ACFFWC_29695 [Plantactinospora siamensis]|uniref:Uncharacterized protein n=1 Tax=Plantactinospora siamensis TaxID=555372 RepID=A0ABV6NP93_9ACTN